MDANGAGPVSLCPTAHCTSFGSTFLSDPTTFQIYLAAGAYMRKLVKFLLFVWKSFTIISGQRVGGFKRKIQIVDCNSMLTVKLLR